MSYLQAWKGFCFENRSGKLTKIKFIYILILKDINNEKKRLNALEEEKHLIESEDLKTQQELMTKRALIATEKKNCEEVQKRLKELEAEIVYL